jgi:3-deoxy-D-manno-octulosonate 8-phosphate phosphatase (KDO 8-P phosphatase)
LMKSFVKQRAAKITLVVFDVDGVLTRGEIIYGPDGEWKVFHAQDGHGFALARTCGLNTALLTGRASPAVRRRAQELRVKAMTEGVADKAAGLRELADKLDTPLQHICYVGDDLVDLAPMAMAGLSVAVRNAVAEVRAAADWVTSREGGKGAAREVIECILKAKGQWAAVVRAARKGAS